MNNNVSGYYFHNTEELTPSDNGERLLRVPSEIWDGLSEQGKSAAYVPVGCELRFVLNSGMATVKLYFDGDEQLAPRLYLHYGYFQSGWINEYPITLHKGCNEIIISQHKNIERLRVIAKEKGHGFSPDVIRLSGFSKETYFLGADGDIRSPKKGEVPEKAAVFYGSSITYGAFSQNINSCYVALAGRRLNIDVYNKGLAGACMLEDKTVDYILSHEADFYVIEAGTNCFGLDKRDWFEERIKYILNAHKRQCPDKRLFLIDKYTFNENHAVCSEIVSSRTMENGNGNVIYIDGHDILESIDNVSADLVHPSLNGHIIMADNLCRIIKEFI